MARLLIASAEESTRRQLVEWLSKDGRELVSVTSTSDALMTVLGLDVDIAFIDLELQDVPGPKAIQLIRRVRPRLPIIILAGELAPASLGRIRGAGIFFTLLKPLDRAEVEEVAASALRKPGRGQAELPPGAGR